MSAVMQLWPRNPVSVERCDVDVANKLLDRWGHDLGPCERPRNYGIEGWVLVINGHTEVSVAISAATVSDHIVDRDGVHIPRTDVVELARLCSDPEHAWATRPMLRLWREVCGPWFTAHRATIALAYSTRRHTGDLYRWDGWEDHGLRPGSGGGGTWSGRRAADDPVAGPKRMWLWRWPG